MSEIRVRGPWMWAWGANILFLWTISLWGWILHRDILLWGGATWATWFIVLEGIGWLANVRHWGEPELARTYSQVMQSFAMRDPGSSWWDTLTGWDLMVTANLLIAGAGVGYVVGVTWHPAFGWAVGVAIAGWNYGHWHNRRKHG